MARPIFTMDFETTTDENDCRVWAWSCYNINTQEGTTGNCIETFFDFLSRESCIGYFHNLKFDSQFIIWYMLNNGYTFTEKPEKPKDFFYLISDLGIFYSGQIILPTGTKCTLYDSYKKIPLAVRDIPAAYGLEIEKTNIKYDAERSTNHEMTEQEKQYLLNDVKIPAMALKQHFDNGLKKMTAPADALQSYKDMIGEEQFEQWFPQLPHVYDDDIRLSYKGGMVLVNKYIREQDIGNGASYDVNSMYTWASNKPLPVGMPIPYSGKYEPDENYPLYIQHIYVAFSVKKGYVPTIQIKGNMLYAFNEYIEYSAGYVDLFLTSVDLKLFLEHYDILDIEYIDGYKFQQAENVFTDYNTFWYNKKKTAKFGERNVAKLMLNSLYGKFGKRIIVKSKEPYLDEDNIVRYKCYKEEVTEPLYTAVASFITSYARWNIATTAQKLGGITPNSYFLYMDTDSVHIRYDNGVKKITDEDVANMIAVSQTELGCFKKEYEFKNARYIRQKCYIEEYTDEYQKEKTGYTEDGEKFTYIDTYVKKCSGMTKQIKDIITYDEFRAGYVIDGVKLRTKNVVGGCILTTTPFSIKGVDSDV